MRASGDRHVVEVAQRPDGGPLAVLSWSTAELDPGVATAELHVVDPGTGAGPGPGPGRDRGSVPGLVVRRRALASGSSGGTPAGR